MEERPPIKGVSPVTGITMYNFLYWLLMHHHELESLQTLSAGQLLYLAQQFESARPDVESSTEGAWHNGFGKLFSFPNHQDDYAAARALLHR